MESSQLFSTAAAPPYISTILSTAAAAKSLQSCSTLCDPIDGSPPGSPIPGTGQPTRLPCPWDSPGKNTGVGCHFLLQCMKVKSESEVAQSCPTLRDPMDCSPRGSSIHGIFQARVLEWVAIAFSILSTGPVICRLFNNGHFTLCKVVYHCSFELHLCNNQQC